MGLARVVPSSASWLAISFMMIPVCAFTICIVILWLDHRIWCIIAEISSLSGWLCWDDGCLKWLLMRYILLRLSMGI